MARAFVRASSQYLVNSNAPISAAPCTLAAWARPDQTNLQTEIFQVVDTAADNGFRLLMHSDGNVYSVARDPSFQAAPVASTGYSVAWHHVAGVFTSTTSHAVFLDGGNKGTDATSVSPTSLDETNIGRFNQGGAASLYFGGLLAELAIWNVALADTEVAILAAGFSPLRVRPGSLVAYWPLISNASPDIDPVGGFDMTVTGATAALEHPGMFYPGARVFVQPGSSTNVSVNISPGANYIQIV